MHFIAVDLYKLQKRKKEKKKEEKSTYSCICVCHGKYMTNITRVYNVKENANVKRKAYKLF